MKFNVLIGPRSFGRGCSEPFELLARGNCHVTLNPFKKVLTECQLMDLIADFDAMIVGLEPVTKRVIEKAERLKVLSKHGTGIDNIDLTAAKEKRVIVTNTPGVNADSVADLTICLMLSIARQIPLNVEVVQGRRNDKVIGREMNGKTLGIIGMGRIGREVVKRVSGFAMQVLYTDVQPQEGLEAEWTARFVDQKTLLRNSDFISLHVPLIPETVRLIGEEELGQMKHSAYLINTSRSGVVDEAALLQALEEEKIAGAALDVYEENSALRDHSKVMCVPHIGAYTYETINRMGTISAENVVRSLQGKQPLFRVV